MRVALATYDNAHQTTPATNSNELATTNNPSISVTNIEGGKVIYGVHFDNTSAITEPTNWTEREDITVSYNPGWGATEYRTGVGERDSTAAGSVTVNPTSAAGSDPTVIVGISINPL